MTQLALTTSLLPARLLQQHLTRQDERSCAVRVTTVQKAVAYSLDAGRMRQRAASEWDRSDVSQAQFALSFDTTELENQMRATISDASVGAFQRSVLVAALGVGLSLVGDPLGVAILPAIGAAMVAIGCLLAAGVVETTRDG